jgi:hypothetical protein
MGLQPPDLLRGEAVQGPVEAEISRLGQEGRRRYEEMHGPLFQTDITEGSFKWLDDPWPWDEGGNE